MFRRKKSTTDIAQRGTPAISISGPMRIAAQAPHPPSSPSVAPLYERFAKPTNVPTDVGAGQGRMSSSSARARVVGGEAAMRRSDVGQVHSGQPYQQHPAVKSGAHLSKAEGRAELGTSAPPREDVPRSSQHYQQQQLSPPTSPILPRANAALTTNRRPMLNVDALDDPPPPTRLMSKSNRVIQERDRENVNIPRAGIKTEKDTRLLRILTPPSPPPATSSISDAPTFSTTFPPSSRTPLRSPANPPPPSSFALPSPSPSSPTSDGSGLLSNGSAIKSSSNLGNSLESRRGPRKAKYSPLAAFGPSISTSTSTVSSSSVPSSQETSSPSPPPPKARVSIVSSPVSVPTFDVSSPHSDLTLAQPDSVPVSYSGPDRLSLGSVSYSDRHASLQPLKTASVELRVGLGVDELQTFHSPLFGAGFGALSSEEHGDDGMETRVNSNPQPRGPPNKRSPNKVSVVMSAVSGMAFFSDDVDAGGEGEGAEERMKTRTGGSNGRVTTVVTPPKMEMEMPPTPPSPSVPQPGIQHDSKKESGENEDGRKRSVSVSSSGSARRKTSVYAKYGDEDVPTILTVHQNQPPMPRTMMRGQIPTPPTSVDGHGQNQRLTIASVLEDERSPVVPSLSSLDSRRFRKTSSTRRVVPELSSSPSADAEANGGARQGELHADIISGEMTGGTTVIPSMSASSSSSAGINIIRREGMQNKPTPKVHTQNLPMQTFSPHHRQDQHQHHAPLSPPQSPPQPLTPAFSPAQSRSRARSKSRTRSNRSDTGSSYVPPSSASSSDGPGRSPSALSTFILLSSNSNGSGNSSPRKLTKTPPLSARVLTESAPDQYEQHQRQITESPEHVNMLVDADPFAKGDIVRELPAGDAAAGSTSVGSMTPPVPPFAYASGTNSGPPSPASPGDYFASRARRRGERLDAKPREAAQALASIRGGKEGEETPRPMMSDSVADADGQTELEPEPEPAEPTFYPLEKHLMHADLLGALLPHLAFRDWCALVAVNDAMRRAVEHRRELREAVLEHFLRTVGYARWKWSTKEHIMLTFRDLNSYMRGVSIPSHQYAVYAKAWLDARQQAQKQPTDEYFKFNLKAATAQKSLLASSCRAYTRVILRLRAQAEAIERDGEGEETVYQFTPPQSTTSVNAKAHAQVQMQARHSMSRVRTGTPSRPASPTASFISHSHSQPGYNSNGNGNGHARVNRYERAAVTALVPRFGSPLFRLGHAPCLRVCVPSPEGVWLSDASVLECERELKRSGIVPLLRVGDVVWDVAVGDEGNVGRMVWDGNYLIDLDYTFSRTGEVPQYLHTLSFPPSYFHRVIRTSGNPICHIDISPWGEEIAANLQLLQDRIKAETPQGGHHTVVRWIHRSKFRVRPNPYTNAPIAIPETSLAVDPGWFGTIIIEIEGTNEGLADLQQRCRTGFPPRAVGGENGDAMKMRPPSKGFRLLRERSRPGEIWLRAVRDKERLL